MIKSLKLLITPHCHQKLSSFSLFFPPFKGG